MDDDFASTKNDTAHTKTTLSMLSLLQNKK